jgi:multidrug efflux system outer membrane protein
VADIPWQDFFADQQLRKVIALALENNRDLRIAALNIEKMRALYQIQRSELFPNVGASTGWSKQRQLISGQSGTDQTVTTERYNISLGISSWELDFLGRIRSLKDQALEQFLATRQARRSAQISLVAEVANAWLTLAADREQLKLARDTLETQQATCQLIQRRLEAGVSSELDLRQAQTQMDAARVDVARYVTLVAQDENAINLLVGSMVPPELLPDSISEKLAAVKDLTPGLSSDVLLNRPDILQAEHILKGANANIGAARADLFPRITLTTNVGVTSSELSSLFKSGSDTWNFAPQIIMPIFNAGSTMASLKAAKADRDIALAQYEKAIQTAFREVADALARRGTIDEQLAAQQSLANAAAASYSLSKARYEKGIDSYLTVLDSQRSLYSAQQGLLNTRLTRLINLLTLYKVLGGGTD